MKLYQQVKAIFFEGLLCIILTFLSFFLQTNALHRMIRDVFSQVVKEKEHSMVYISQMFDVSRSKYNTIVCLAIKWVVLSLQ